MQQWMIIFSLILLTATASEATARQAPARVEPAELRGALFSIYTHAHPERFKLEGDAAPELPSLDDAVTTILSDNSESRGYTVRHAITELTIGRFKDGRIHDDDVRHALKRLGAPLSALEQGLSEEPGYPDEATAVIQQVLSVNGLGSDCAKGQADVFFNPFTQITTANYTVTNATRPFDEVARAIDPQNWQHCSTYFEASYVAKEVDGGYPLDGNNNAEKENNPPDPGTTWTGTIFEFFDFSVQMGFLTWDGWFKNLLAVNTARTGTQFAFTYQLKDSIEVRTGLLTVPKGLNLDDGFSTAVEQSDGTVNVTGQKRFRYSWPLAYLNVDVQLFLWGMGQEAKKIVCTCQPPVVEAPPKPWWEVFWEWLLSWFYIS